MPALTPFVGFPFPFIDKITNLCRSLWQVVSECSFLVLTAVWLSSECVVCWKVSAVFCVHHVPVNLGVHGCFLALHCFCKTTVNASSAPAPHHWTRFLGLQHLMLLNATVSCHRLGSPPTPFIVSYVCVRAQSCMTLCSPMDYNPPGSSVHGIFQARVLEWVAISFSRELYHIEADLLWSLLPHC